MFHIVKFLKVHDYSIIIKNINFVIQFCLGVSLLCLIGR